MPDRWVRSGFAAGHGSDFIDPALQQYATQDAPLPIGEGQTISQPFVVALMLQALNIQPGDQVLEIGAGSGFQTALLCELAATPDDTRGVTVYAQRHGSVSRILGSDTGPGLARKARDNLFAACRGSARSGGTGLALAIAHELVRAHGGTNELVESIGGRNVFAI